jgi:uncharacterized protein YceK
MNDKTGSNRNLRCARALAAAAAAAVLTAGCGVVHVHFGSSGGPSSTVHATYQQELAYAQCVRSHGLPDFPLPSPSGPPGSSWQLTASPGSSAARANNACKHLLSGATGP